MSIRKRKSKRAKKGHVYEVYITKNNQKIYQKSGFLTRKEAEEHEVLMSTLECTKMIIYDVQFSS